MKIPVIHHLSSTRAFLYPSTQPSIHPSTISSLSYHYLCCAQHCKAAGVSPSCYRRQLQVTYIQTAIRTHTERANLELPLSLTFVSLDCWRKLKCLENPCRHRANMQTPHSKSPGSGDLSDNLLCIAVSARLNVLSAWTCSSWSAAQSYPVSADP